MAKPGANAREVASTVPRGSPRSNVNNSCHLGEQLSVLSIAMAKLGAICREVASAALQSKSSGYSSGNWERGLSVALIAH